MSSYTLVYFNVMGRAEPIRYMLAIAGVKYEDKRVPRGEEWAKMKETTPLGQLPILYVDGKKLPQSRAIYRYVAREHGLYGSNSWEQARVDVVCEMIDEIWRRIVRIVWEKDDAKKEALRKAFTEQLPKLSENVQKLLKQNKGGEDWFVGDKISLADAIVYAVLVDFLPVVGKCQIEEHLTGQDALKGFLSRFKSHPKVAEWIKNRPKTDF